MIMEDIWLKRKALPIGIDNFEKLITRGYYFIDKSLLIKDLIDNKASVNLFTRPRRFGKTLNISMLQYYFEDMRNEFTGEKKDNSFFIIVLYLIFSHYYKIPCFNR